MRVHVLGSAAGGGFPQWNCNSGNNQRLHEGTTRAQARTQSSITVSADGERWVLINVSPDVRQQVIGFPGMRPAPGTRETGIAAIVLIDSQIDHTAGLLVLREGAPLNVWSTEPVREDLSTGLPLFKLLDHYCTVNWHEISLQQPDFRIPQAPGLSFRAIQLESAAPPYSPHRNDPDPNRGDNIGLLITDERTDGKLFYAPGLGKTGPGVADAMAAADCMLVDGSFFYEDEMVRMGVGTKPASAMGHLRQSGPGGMLELLGDYPDKRRVLIHINNTNPILDPDSPERAEVEAAGVEVAYDGMDIEL